MYSQQIGEMLTIDRMWRIGYGPKEYGLFLANSRKHSHKRTNRKNK